MGKPAGFELQSNMSQQLQSHIAKILLGNSAVAKDDGGWQWQLFLDAGEYYQQIERVTLQLHHTFDPSTYEYDGAAFDSQGTCHSHKFTGWGTFVVGVTIHWQGGVQSKLSHKLVFENGGASEVVEVEKPRTIVKQPTVTANHGDPKVSNIVAPEQISRNALQKRLAACHEFAHDDPRFFHGRAFDDMQAQAPRSSWKSNQKPRDDHDAADWLTATEFEDVEEMLEAKCELLAQMLRMSKKTVVYSGAGISVAACIGQAAVGSGGAGEKSLDALPTKTHYALAALAKHGLLHGWVQQNHDGLPQKAGFPQEHINEIHGSWFDPSNPVVLYSGTLKSDAYPWMRQDANTADLVIVVGTSLGGLNADQVATKTAERSTKDKPWRADGKGGALGTVLINLQQTEQDGKSSLRVFGTTDTVLSRVLVKLGIADVTPCTCGQRFCRQKNGYMYGGKAKGAHPWELLLPGADGTLQPPRPAQFPAEPVAIVPYDEDGNRSDTVKMRLDFRDGQKVKITSGHNTHGAGQPAYLHIGAKKPYTRPAAYGGQTMQPGPGHGIVMQRLEHKGAYQLLIEGVHMELGVWWLEAAKRGQLEKLPIVNLDPVMQRCADE